MSTETLEQAIATTRGVLTSVSKEQLGDDTPCAEWKVSDLINHIVGGAVLLRGRRQGRTAHRGRDRFFRRRLRLRVRRRRPTVRRRVPRRGRDGKDAHPAVRTDAGRRPSSGSRRPTRSPTAGISPRRRGRTPTSRRSSPASCSPARRWRSRPRFVHRRETRSGPSRPRRPARATPTNSPPSSAARCKASRADHARAVGTQPTVASLR